MKAEQLWKELSYLFDTDDGSLPEIWLTNLSSHGVAAIFSYLQHGCRSVSNASTFWSIKEQTDKPINSVPNAAALVVEGRAEPFCFTCQGLTCGGVVIPDIGVFVFPNEIDLFYRMGKEWNAEKLKALFGMLKALKKIEPRITVTIEDYALPKVRKQFETTWEKFLQVTTDV
jgi:hypothetical protein